MVSTIFFLISLFCTIVSNTTIIGGGSSLPFSLITKWSFSFLDIIPRIIVKYSVSNGNIGFNNVVNGNFMYSGTFKFRNTVDTVYQFPICATPIVIIYNLPNVTIPLKLDRQSMVDIFTGNITHWRDTHLLELNPFLKDIEDKPIIIYLGLNSMPITYFTSALSFWSPVWRERYGVLSTWPTEFLNSTNTVLLPTNLNTLITSYVQAIPYSLSFGLLSDAFDIGVSYALLEENNVTLDAAQSGPLIFQPSIEVDIKNFSTLINNTLNLSTPGIWPIIGLTFAVISTDPQFPCNDFSDMLKFFIWALTSDIANTAAIRSGYLPIQESITQSIADFLLNLNCQGYPAINRTIQHKDLTSGGAVLCIVVSYLGIISLPLITCISWGENKITRVFHGSLSGASLLALASITFWWLEPTNVVCQLRIWLFGIGSSMVMASVFNYMWRFYLVNKTVKEKKWNKKIPIFQTTLVSMILIFLLELVFLSIWTGIDPYLQQFEVVDANDFIGTYSCSSNLTIWMPIQYGFFFILNIWGIYAVTVAWSLQTKQVRWVIMSIYTTLVTMIVLFVYTQLIYVDDSELLYISTVFVMVVAIGFNISLLIPKVIDAHSIGSLKREKTTSEGSLKIKGLKGSRGTLSEDVNEPKEKSKTMVSVLIPQSLEYSDQDKKQSSNV